MSNLFQPQADWLIVRLGKAHRVRFTQTDNQITGRYVDINNPSTFLGEVLIERGMTLIHFTQTTSSSDYHAVHIGKLLEPDSITGHWFDTAGHAGEFTLSRQPDLSEAIANAKQRAIATRLRNSNPPNPDASEITLESLENLNARLDHIRGLIADGDYSNAISQLNQVHHLAPQDSRVFSLLGQIFLDHRMGYLATAFTQRAFVLNAQDELAQANSQRLQQLTTGELSQTDLDRYNRDDNRLSLVKQYLALFAPISPHRMVPPTAGVISADDYRRTRSHPEPINIKPQRPTSRFHRSRQNWFKRLQRWLRRIWVRLFAS
jgi:hypothetical protein